MYRPAHGCPAQCCRLSGLFRAGFKNPEFYKAQAMRLPTYDKPRIISLSEENEEYLEAVQNNDIVEIADALGDMLYILCGTILEHGLQHKIEEVFDEIQRSNMSKLGEDGKPIYREDGKVMKGPNYFKPNFSDILK